MSTTYPIPVKTVGINEIDRLVETLKPAYVKTVITKASEPVDRETVEYPVLFAYDDDEGQPENRNQLRIGSYGYNVWVWLENEDGAKEISREADVLQAQLYNLLVLKRSAVLAELGIVIREGNTPINKVYENETEGGALIKFNVIYMCQTKDMYTV